jgi:hypothetical protein
MEWSLSASHAVYSPRIQSHDQRVYLNEGNTPSPSYLNLYNLRSNPVLNYKNNRFHQLDNCCQFACKRRIQHDGFTWVNLYRDRHSHMSVSLHLLICIFKPHFWLWISSPTPRCPVGSRLRWWSSHQHHLHHSRVGTLVSPSTISYAWVRDRC